MWSKYLQRNYANMEYAPKINMKWMKAWDKEWEVLQKALAIFVEKPAA